MRNLLGLRRTVLHGEDTQNALLHGTMFNMHFVDYGLENETHDTYRNAKSG